MSKRPSTGPDLVCAYLSQSSYTTKVTKLSEPIDVYSGAVCRLLRAGRRSRLRALKTKTRSATDGVSLRLFMWKMQTGSTPAKRRTRDDGCGAGGCSGGVLLPQRPSVACTIIAEQKHENSLVSPCSQCCKSESVDTTKSKLGI